ncbi:MAG: F0F1 ATP synthase subunit A [Chloroflexi bacterium]|nr:F0F1 ATP synthase subunit A [Chloroflexota bacterium]
MARFLSNPKVLAVVLVVGVLFLVGLLGGALGDSLFGTGFLKSPVAHIQLPSEHLFTDPFISLGPPGQGSFFITNSMLATWVTILVLISVALLVRRRLSLVPRGLQNLVEVIFEAFLGLVESVAGAEKGRRFFPLVITIFLFIVTANWLGILPGFGTVGRLETADYIIEETRHRIEEKGEKEHKTIAVIEHEIEAELKRLKLQVYDGSGSVSFMPLGTGTKEITAYEYEEMKGKGDLEGRRVGLLVPFLRSANTDLNSPLSIALIAMFMVEFWGIKALGFFGYGRKFINIGSLLRGKPFGIIDAFVGTLEGVSEFARLISFTFRLFGNIFAGEVLLVAMGFLIPLVGIAPFFGLELFVGFIQAFIFAMLTLVFAVMATAVHESGEH